MGKPFQGKREANRHYQGEGHVQSVQRTCTFALKGKASLHNKGEDGTVHSVARRQISNRLVTLQKGEGGLRAECETVLEKRNQKKNNR